MKSINIIIPVFNEAENIIPLCHAIQKNLPDRYNYHITFVDDGSTDNTISKLHSIRSEYSNVNIIRFTRNFGQQAAFYAGLEHSNTDAVITMDGDFQDPPELIPKLIEEWEKGYFVVNGRRKIRKNDMAFKRFSAKLFYYFLSLFSICKIPAHVGDFRLIDKRVVNELKKMPHETHYIRGIIAWLGFDNTEINYERPERIKGKTKYTLSKMIDLALYGLFSFSKIPFKFGLFLGSISILIGFLFITYMAVDIMVNSVSYPLFKWLVVIILIFIGFLFILFWIIGEYIVRIYDTKRNRPLYIIDSKSNNEVS